VDDVVATGQEGQRFRPQQAMVSEISPMGKPRP
jgi:hypothetical protein